MASSEDRLPRVAHAERPRPDEKILWKTGADLNNGWLGRHGTLYLTEQRLVFVPTPLDHLLRAKRREIAREDIEAIERFPLSPGVMPRGAKRPRMYLFANGVRSLFLVPDLDPWSDILEGVYTRAHEADSSVRIPEIRRNGITNALLDLV
ncbi:MAG: hypothetical protein JHC53_07040 [Thermoleophilia bacterium]|nr:hypothetical protein [Thermoleophilia bacterium]